MFDPGDAGYVRSLRLNYSDIWILVSCLSGWVFRAFLDRVGWRRDGLLIVAISCFLRFSTLLEAANYLSGLIVSLRGTYSGAFILLLMTGCLSAYKNSQPAKVQVSKEPEQTTWTNPLKPLLFPCCTSHTRLFPKRHSFSYSYLFVGVPVGWTGSAGSMIAADAGKSSGMGPPTKSGWFRVEARDHLDRGNAHLGLYGKLRVYLESQGESIEHYPLSYLVTAPMFLGYAFNPVSFWYLYSHEMQLKAMVLEVNNTFDERRMYLLKGTSDPEAESFVVQQAVTIDGTSMKPLEPPEPSNTGRFTDAWVKDFHVSPFSSRKGSYALSAYDPFFLSQSRPRTINNTITLSSSKDHPKLVARIFSTGPAIDPSEMSLWFKIRFIASWWWVGFVTFPRIVREAGKLFFRRKLHVWYRPEVLKDSIGRTETVREQTIEVCFRKFLKERVEQSSMQMPLKYIAAGTDSKREEIFYPKLATTVPEKFTPDGLQFKVLTPLFYSSIVRFAHIAEFIHSEELLCDDKKRTFWTSDAQKLLQLLGEKQILGLDTTNLSYSNWMSRIQWATLRHLRRSPRYSTTKEVPQGKNVLRGSAYHDIRSFRLSALDQFVLSSCNHSQMEEYRIAVSTLLLSDYVAFGVPELIDAFDLCIRLLLCYVFVDTAVDWVRTLFSRCIFMTFSGVILSCNAVHVWWLFKRML